MKMISLIYCCNGKVTSDEKDISYEGLPPMATVIRSRATFHEFMEKLYQVIGCEKCQTRLTVACRYLIQNEYITLPVTDQGTIEVAFAMVAPSRCSPKLYIDTPGILTLHKFLYMRLGYSHPT